MSTTKIVCYHHNDNDGKAAGYIVWNNVGGNLTDYHQTTYNDKFDYDVTGADVYIVDLSFTATTIYKLFDILDGRYGIPNNVIWIDHHKGTVDDIINDKTMYLKLLEYKNLRFIVYDGYCGAILTYIYFNIDHHRMHQTKYFKFNDADISPERIIFSDADDAFSNAISISWDVHKNSAYTIAMCIPEWLIYIDDHDCWKKKYVNTEYFILGLDSNDTRLYITERNSDGAYVQVINYTWKLIAESVDALIDVGHTISRYREAVNARNLHNRFEVMIDGQKCLAMNARGNSIVFGEYIDKYPCCVLYFYDGVDKNWSMTFYSSLEAKNRMDCSILAKRYGGGGHFGAAGCSVDKPANEIFEMV